MRTWYSIKILHFRNAYRPGNGQVLLRSLYGLFELKLKQANGLSIPLRSYNVGVYNIVREAFIRIPRATSMYYSLVITLTLMMAECEVIILTLTEKCLNECGGFYRKFWRSIFLKIEIKSKCFTSYFTWSSLNDFNSELEQTIRLSRMKLSVYDSVNCDSLLFDGCLIMTVLFDKWSTPSPRI